MVGCRRFAVLTILCAVLTITAAIMILSSRTSAQTDLLTPPTGMVGSAFYAHNLYRAKHCVPPLRWSPILAAEAQRYADQCIFEHDQSTDLGENIGLGELNGDEIVESWYDEGANYDFDKPKYEGFGDFTQVIWKDTVEVGCAVTVCSGANNWVCRYSPGAATEEQGLATLRENVLPVCKR